MKRTMLVMAMAVALALSTLGFASASGTALYDTVPDPLPSNYASLGYQATATSEFGQQVTLTDATADTATIGMSSWACADGVIWTAGCGEVTEGNETFSHPITLNIYENDAGSAGTLLTSVTQDVNVPFRPAADGSCAEFDEEGDVVGTTDTRWKDEAGVCNNGYAFTVTFDLATTLPTDFIFGVAYDTGSYGEDPLGVTGPYDALNVGLTMDAPSVGTAGDIFWDSVYLGRVAGFTNDGGDWGYNVIARFGTSPEATADDCKNGGWMTFGDYTNQGQCIASFKANENAGK